MKFKVSILNFLMLAALSFVPLHIAYSQTASILPPAKTTFFDKNGNPLAFGKAEFYIPGTTTPKMTWQDSGQTIPNTNPVILDNAGRGLILGDGSYRQIIRDKNNNLIWDQITSSAGSGGGGGGTPTVGDGDPVGTIKVWSGLVAPAQYAFPYGQEFTRASYPELFQSLTSQQNVNCTSGSPTLTGLSSTEQLSIGSDIETSCLNSGATIISKTTSTVTASSNAVISTSTSARFFPYGNGNGSTTFNLPDLRGRIVAGRDNMGGIASNRIPSVYSSLGGSGGNANVTLSTANLPPYSPSGSITNGAITTNITGSPVVGSISAGVQGGSTFPNSVVNLGVIGATSTQAASTFSGNAQGGSSTPFSVIQPTQSYNYIIKVLPDTNPNSFFGVASLGGMYGVIECGFGITCSGNVISAINSLVPSPTSTTLGGVYESYAPSNQFAIGVDAAGNILYGGGSTTVNGQVCTIGGSCTITATAGTITVGTTLVNNGSNNGILYKNSSGILASTTSAANNIVITDGFGAPTLSATLPANNLATNSIANFKLAKMNAATFKGNPTNSTANAQDFTIQGLNNLPSPSSTLDYLPIYDHTTGTIKNVTPGAIASSGTAGVTSFNGATGAVSASPSDKRIYVSTFGNDSNNGLSPETPKLTLQAAVNAASGGGIVNVGSGAYLLTSTLNMQTHVKLSCSPGTLITQSNGANIYELISFSNLNAHYASITNCLIKGNRPNNADDVNKMLIRVGTAQSISLINNKLLDSNGYGVVCNNCYDLRIQNNQFVNFYMSPIAIFGSPPSTTSASYNLVNITNNTIIGPFRGGILMGNSNSFDISNNTINGGSLLGSDYNPLIVNTSGTTVTWVSGPNFSNIKPGQFVIINNGAEFLITSVNSSTSITVSTTLPTLSGIPAVIGSGDGIGIVGSSFGNITNNIVSNISSFCMGTSIGGNDSGTIGNLFANNNIAYCMKNAINITYDFGNGSVVANSIIGNHITNSGLNSTAVGIPDRDAIAISTTNTAKLTQTRLVGNTISSYNYGKFSEYWLFTDSNLSNGSVFVSGNIGFSLPGDSYIHNDISSITLSSQFGSSATVASAVSTGDGVNFTINSAGTGQANYGVVTITKKSDSSSSPMPHAVIRSATAAGLYSLPFGGETTTPGNWTTTFLGTMAAGNAMNVVMR